MATSRNRKTVYIHIGHLKTGSTAIQTSLYKNRGFLKEHGIVYPNSGLVKDSVIGNRHYALSKNISQTSKEWLKLIKEIERSAQNKIVISYEGFIRLSRAEVEVIGELFKGYNVKIICYLRGQVDFIQSLYAEYVQNHSTKQSFRQFEGIFNYQCYYHALLNNWASVFDKNNIIVKSFPALVAEKKDLIADFMSELGLDFELPVPPQRKNATLSPFAVAILQEWNKCSGPLSLKRAFALKLNEVLENNKLLKFFHNDKKPTFISDNMKLVMAAQYQAENRMLARDYGVALFENENKPSQAVITQSSKFRTRLVSWLIGNDLGANINSNTSRIAGEAATNKKVIFVSLLLAFKERLQSCILTSNKKQTLLDGVFVPNSQLAYAKKVLSNASELPQADKYNLDSHYFIVLDTTQVPKKFVTRSLANIESVFGSGVTIVQVDKSIESWNKTIDVSCYQGVIYHSAWHMFLPEVLTSLQQFLESKYNVLAVKTESIDWHHAIYDQNHEQLTNIATKFTEHQINNGLKSISEIVKTFELLDNTWSYLQKREPLLQVRLNKPNAL